MLHHTINKCSTKSLNGHSIILKYLICLVQVTTSEGLVWICGVQWCGQGNGDGDWIYHICYGQVADYNVVIRRGYLGRLDRDISKEGFQNGVFGV